MATVRDSDTSLWLHNKLGDSEDLWSGISSISTQLKQDVLENIHHCFVALTPTVKLKLLMAILHMPRRTVEELKEELSAILHLALTDTDQWVSTIADILRSYPTTGQLNLDLEENHPFIAETLKDLRKTLSATDTNALLPLECQYLNKNALNQLVGMQVPPVKHFQLKRKPKSAALRAELLQKSAEAQQQSKKLTASSSVPIKIRGLSRKSFDDSPMRGIPNKSSGFRPGKSPASRMPLNRTGSRLSVNRQGGTKLLDIAEQPIGGNSREAKKRKRQQEIEAQEQVKKEKEKEKEAAEATPDYAAALMSPAVSKKPNVVEEPPVPTATPSYAPRADYTEPATPGPSILSTIGPNPPSSTTLAARENLHNTLQHGLQQHREYHKPNTTIAASTPPAIDFTPSTTYNPSSSAAEPPPYHNPSASQPQTSQPTGLKMPTVSLMGNTTLVTNLTGQVTKLTTPTRPIQPPVPPQPSQPAVAAAVAAAAAPKKGLSLTRDQMIAAQEMFRQSNKVTRPEKALILGFMAGARDNPCPQQGDIVTIRLSENNEMIQKDDESQSTMLVDTFFEMNYATGEWRRYKKYKPMLSL